MNFFTAKLQKIILKKKTFFLKFTKNSLGWAGCPPPLNFRNYCQGGQGAHPPKFSHLLCRGNV